MSTNDQIHDKQLDLLAEEFNKILREKGFNAVQIQSFKIAETDVARKGRCKKKIWVVSNGRRFRRCVKR